MANSVTILELPCCSRKDFVTSKVIALNVFGGRCGTANVTDVSWQRTVHFWDFRNDPSTTFLSGEGQGWRLGRAGRGPLATDRAAAILWDAPAWDCFLFYSLLFPFGSVFHALKYKSFPSVLMTTLHLFECPYHNLTSLLWWPSGCIWIVWVKQWFNKFPFALLFK